VTNREESSVPTSIQRDADAQSAFLSTVRESQAAVIDVLRAWTDISQQFARNLRLPVAAVDVAGAVDRAFDVAEQSLAAQREIARTLAGVATRQADAAVEAVDTAVDTTVETVAAPKAESSKDKGQPDRRTYEERSIEELRERARELDIEGRSAMSKDELIAALRKRGR
jgi:hypothetical protein